MDWNRDGKEDWRDDAFISTVLNSEEDTKLDPSERWSPSGAGFGWLLIIIALIIISFFF